MPGLPCPFGFGFDSHIRRAPGVGAVSPPRSRLAAIPLAVLACLVVPAVAGADAERARENQDQAKAKIERVSAALGKDRERLDAAAGEAEAAARREAEYSGLIATGAERAAELGQRVAGSERELGEAKRRLARARKLLRDRLVAIYMSGPPDVVGLALGSDSYADLASGTVYLRAISESDTRLATRVSELRSDLAGTVARLGEAKAAVDAHNARLETARAGIAAARVAAESTAAELAAVNESRQAEIGELKSNIKSWQKRIEREQAASAEEAERQVEQDLGGPYSIPTYIVMCESGGDYSALNPSSGAGGAYQIMPSTWEAYGGKGLPHEASKAEQDRIAALIWAESGASPWVCG